MKPKIGFTTHLVEIYRYNNGRVRGMPDQDMLVSAMDYNLVIHEAGGLPLGIALIDDDHYIEDMISNLDGIVFTGGGDVNPTHYKQNPSFGIGGLEPTRDEFELKLMKKCIEKNIPILGVCRGMQLLNVYFGGTLTQEIKGTLDTNIDHVNERYAQKWLKVHNVYLDEKCDLYKAYGEKTVFVNSVHHQAVDKLGDGLQVCGLSEDGLIESICHAEKPHIFGVQWHPEMMFAKYPDEVKPYRLLVEYALDRIK